MDAYNDYELLNKCNPWTKIVCIRLITSKTIMKTKEKVSQEEMKTESILKTRMVNNGTIWHIYCTFANGKNFKLGLKEVG